MHGPLFIKFLIFLMNGHIVQRYNKERNYKCTRCGLKFRFDFPMNRQMVQRHNKDIATSHFIYLCHKVNHHTNRSQSHPHFSTHLHCHCSQRIKSHFIMCQKWKHLNHLDHHFPPLLNLQ